MKLIIIIILTCFITPAFAQEKFSDTLYSGKANNDVLNFKIDNGSVIWQKIYKTNYSKEEIINHFKKSGFIKNLELSEDLLTGEIKNIEADYAGAGYRKMSTPMVLLSENISAFVSIQFKETRYRVTVKQIKFATMLETTLSKIGETIPIERYALRKKNTIFKNDFLGDPCNILDYTFNKIFEIKEKAEDEDW